MTSRVNNRWTTHAYSCLVNEYIWHTGSSHIAALWLAKSDGTLAEPARCLIDAWYRLTQVRYLDTRKQADNYPRQRFSNAGAHGLKCLVATATDRASISRCTHVTWRPPSFALKKPARSGFPPRVTYRVAPMPWDATAPSVTIHNWSLGHGKTRMQLYENWFWPCWNASCSSSDYSVFSWDSRPATPSRLDKMWEHLGMTHDNTLYKPREDRIPGTLVGRKFFASVQMRWGLVEIVPRYHVQPSIVAVLGQDFDADKFKAHLPTLFKLWSSSEGVLSPQYKSFVFLQQRLLQADRRGCYSLVLQRRFLIPASP